MSSSGASTPTTEVAPTSTFGDNRGIRFTVKTGGKSWACTLQDRSAYERMKATRTSSTDSVSSTVSNVSEKST